MRLSRTSWGDPEADIAVALLHGITGAATSWVSIGPALAARGHHAVAVDLRGHGGSPTPNDGYGLAALVADVVESLPRPPDVLVGHSFGGTLAALAVADGALAPAVLVLEDPVLHLADRSVPSRVLDEEERRTGTGLDLDNLAAAFPRWTAVDLAAKLLAVQQVSFSHARMAFVDNVPWDLRPRLGEASGRSRIRCVLPHGSQYVPDCDASRIAADLGPGSVTYVADAGHSVHRDQPDAFLRILDEATEHAARADQ